MPIAMAHALLVAGGLLLFGDRPPPPSEGDPAPAAAAMHARPRLICETDALIAGREATLAVDFEIDEGWHLYWDGLNDSGLPPRIRLSLPGGFEAGEVLWPAPKRHVLPGGILDHIYEKRVTLLIPIRVPADTGDARDAVVSADIDWLVCDEVCLPESAHVSLTVPIAAAAGPGPESALIRKVRAALPKPEAEAPQTVRASVSDGVVTLRAPGASRMEFFPGRDGVPPIDAIGECETRGDRLSFRLKDPAPGRHVQGIWAVWQRAGGVPSVYTVDVVIPAPDSAEHSPTPGVPPAGKE